MHPPDPAPTPTLEPAPPPVTVIAVATPPAPTIRYSPKEYNPNVRVLYLRDHQEANRELAKLGSGPQVLGFDLEWKPCFVKGGGSNPVALVQLSNHDVIFLLQVTAMKEFPSELEQILANPSIIKTGVAIQSDAKKMYVDCHVPVYSCVDLSLLARTVDNASWKGGYNQPLGLARLIETYEHRLLPKGRITRSNWEAKLNALQIEYASSDAHAGYILYKKLQAMIPSLQAPPKTVWYTFNCVSGRLLDSEGQSWNPNNPNYDPGPPPAPKIPKAPKITDIVTVEEVSQSTGESSASTSTVACSSSSQDPKLPRVQTAPLGRVEVERRPRNTLPSHPYGAAYQEQAKSREGSGSSSASSSSNTGTGPVAQQLPNKNSNKKNKVQQQRRSDKVDRDLQASSSSSSGLTMGGIRTQQPKRAKFPTASSTQSYENTLRPFGTSSAGERGIGSRVDSARGPHTQNTNNINNNSQSNSERSMQARRKYHRSNHHHHHHHSGQDASTS